MVVPVQVSEVTLVGEGRDVPGRVVLLSNGTELAFLHTPNASSEPLLYVHIRGAPILYTPLAGRTLRSLGSSMGSLSSDLQRFSRVLSPAESWPVTRLRRSPISKRLRRSAIFCFRSGTP